MEETFRLVASNVALAVEVAAVATVAIGAAEAAYRILRGMISGGMTTGRLIWVRFASWIILSLEFALGADIIRTAIAPSWDDIGKLAAIAGIRTVLNYFLAKDVEDAIRGEKVKDEATAG